MAVNHLGAPVRRLPRGPRPRAAGRRAARVGRAPARPHGGPRPLPPARLDHRRRGGSAFDKVARFLGLGYPGGPVIDRLAAERPTAIAFRGDDRPHGEDRHAFSFSGLKTAVVNHVRRHRRVDGRRGGELQDGRRRARHQGPRAARGRRQGPCSAGAWPPTARCVRWVEACEEDGLRPFVPSRVMCTDNAAMIAAAAGGAAVGRPSPSTPGRRPTWACRSPGEGAVAGGRVAGSSRSRSSGEVQGACAGPPAGPGGPLIDRRSFLVGLAAGAGGRVQQPVRGEETGTSVVPRDVPPDTAVSCRRSRPTCRRRCSPSGSPRATRCPTR